MWRQGDVLIVPVDELPAELIEVPREDGRVVLAHGEATGHAHAIREPAARLYDTPDDVVGRMLVLEMPGIVEHEEHDEIRLPAGSYQIIRQREYTPEQVRPVVD